MLVWDKHKTYYVSIKFPSNDDIIAGLDTRCYHSCTKWLIHLSKSFCESVESKKKRSDRFVKWDVGKAQKVKEQRVSERTLRFTPNGDGASKLCSRVLVASGIDFPLSGLSTLQSCMWQVGKWNSSFWCVQPGVIPSVFIPSVTSEIPLTRQFKKASPRQPNTATCRRRL